MTQLSESLMSQRVKSVSYVYSLMVEAASSASDKKRDKNEKVSVEVVYKSLKLTVLHLLHCGKLQGLPVSRRKDMCKPRSIYIDIYILHT